mmetsp:Transcript_2847/g.4033  ORF Transcript_2847/g.4033 Transcript_2847/m.4033 type:complete len:145 (-) Transcript_2847:203-637(-)
MLDSMHKNHCYRRALNKHIECEHEHSHQMCKACLQPIKVFDMTACMLDKVIKQMNDGEELYDEVLSMKKACNDIMKPTIKSYMSHQVQAVAQLKILNSRKILSHHRNVDNFLMLLFVTIHLKIMSRYWQFLNVLSVIEKNNFQK